MENEIKIRINLNRFKICSEYKSEIRFDFCNGYITKLNDIKKAIENGFKGTSVPFGDKDKFIPDMNKDINYHINRVIYFINNPNEIKDIKIRSAWWINNNTLFARPHLEIVDGYHRIASAFYLNLKYIDIINYDYIRNDVMDYITEKSNVVPKKIRKVKLNERN